MVYKAEELMSAVDTELKGLSPAKADIPDKNEVTGEALAIEALRALLYEVIITPKPGLVDSHNTGAHDDMNIETFFNSAFAITGYFVECFNKGRKLKDIPPEEVLPYFTPLGIAAEKKMYQATGGVNTHKGAIFTIRAIMAAAGMLYEKEASEGKKENCFDPGTILDYAGRICSPMTGGTEHLRREVRSGYPTIRYFSLPAAMRFYDSIKESGYPERNKYKKINTLGVRILLLIMAHLEDVNIIRRGGDAMMKKVRQCCRDILEKNPSDCSLLKEAENIDRKMIEWNVSPGGCADLLAATLFLRSVSGDGSD